MSNTRLVITASDANSANNLEITAREVRVYTKRVRKFNLQQQNAIIKSVKEIGVMPTAEKFNTLYIRVAKIVKGRKVKVARGRRPSPKAVAA